MRILKSFGLAHVLPVFTLFAVFGLDFDANAYTSITSRENQVTVEVEPVQLAPGQAAKFEVSMNTHTVSLGHDMVVVSTLTDDQGREYRPMNWQGSGPSGHHRSGVLEFPTLDGNPESVTLVIKDISNVVRTFKWKVER